MNNTNVTLKQFLNIVGGSLVRPYLCTVFLETHYESNGLLVIEPIKFEDNNKFFECKDDLTPYLNFEITSYNQDSDGGEILGESICLRRVCE